MLSVVMTEGTVCYKAGYALNKYEEEGGHVFKVMVVSKSFRLKKKIFFLNFVIKNLRKNFFFKFCCKKFCFCLWCDHMRKNN